MARIDKVFKNGISSVSGIGAKALSKIMGLSVLLYSMQMQYVNDAWGQTGLLFTFSMILMVVCSFLILVDMSYNLNRTIGLYAFSLGFNRVARYMDFIFYDRAIISIFGIVMVCLALNLMVTGIYFLRGSTRGRLTMQLSAGAMIFVSIFVITFVVTTSGAGSMSFEILFNTRPDMFILMVMYTLLICILSSEAIRMTDAESIRSANMRALGHTEATTDRSYIDRHDAEVLAASFEDRSSWKEVGIGPIESEYTFRINHGVHDNSFVRVQKWKGEDGLYFTITDRESDTTLNAYRFRAESIQYEGDFLRIYGNKGERMRITVAEVI